MKRLFNLFSLLLLSSGLFAQAINYTDLPNITRAGSFFLAYTSKDHTVFKVGDKIKLGFPSSNKTFAFIYEGDGIITSFTPVSSYASGQNCEIKKIYVGGSKKTGFSIWFRTTGQTILANYTIYVENAIASGELISAGFTSDEALAELKKAKDKLDLGLITQDDYDSIKSELVKYID